MRQVVEWAERRQVPLYLAAVVIGAVVGLVAPGVTRPLEAAIAPVLGALLFATFLGVPFARWGLAVRDVRFLGAVALVNFVLVPAVVFGLSRFVAHDAALLVGVLLVLLAPCIDYVIVFTGLAGGSSERLLAVTPLLLVGQMLLLPVYLWLMAGAEVASAFDPRPFVDAFLLLIALPAGGVALVHLLGRRFVSARMLRAGMLAAMVPLMMLTLALVVGSQVAVLGASIGAVLVVIPLFLAFPVVVAPLGFAVARVARLDGPGRRAVVFSGVTRNSLVVLPLALALPAHLAVAPLVVVTQTVVELVVMVTLVAAAGRIDARAGGRRERLSR